MYDFDICRIFNKMVLQDWSIDYWHSIEFGKGKFLNHINRQYYQEVFTLAYKSIYRKFNGFYCPDAISITIDQSIDFCSNVEDFWLELKEIIEFKAMWELFFPLLTSCKKKTCANLNFFALLKWLYWMFQYMVKKVKILSRSNWI